MADVIGARTTATVGDMRPRKVGSVTEEERAQRAQKRAREILAAQDVTPAPPVAPPKPQESAEVRELREQVERVERMAEERGLKLLSSGWSKGYRLVRMVATRAGILPPDIDDIGRAVTPIISGSLEDILEYLVTTEAPNKFEGARAREAHSLADALGPEPKYRPPSELREPRDQASAKAAREAIRARGIPLPPVPEDGPLSPPNFNSR